MAVKGAAEAGSGKAAGGFRARLGRQALDLRPLAIAPYRRLLIGQGTAFIGSMLTQVAV